MFAQERSLSMVFYKTTCNWRGGIGDIRSGVPSFARPDARGAVGGARSTAGLTGKEAFY